MKSQAIVIICLVAVVAVLIGFIVGQNIPKRKTSTEYGVQLGERKVIEEEVKNSNDREAAINVQQSRSQTRNESIQSEKYSTDDIVLPDEIAKDLRVSFGLSLAGYDPTINSGTVYTVGVMKVKTRGVAGDSVIYFTTPILQYVTSNGSITSRIYDNMESCISSELSVGTYSIQQRGYYASADYAMANTYLHYFKGRHVCAVY